MGSGDLKRQSAAFICKISASSRVSQCCVNEIVNSANVMVGDIVQSASVAVSSAFKKHGLRMDSPAYEEIQSHLSMLEQPFDCLGSDFKRMKYFKTQSPAKSSWESDLRVGSIKKLDNMSRFQWMTNSPTFLFLKH